MNIRKRYTKVCLFLWVIGMCLCTQSVIPVPLKMEQGTGSFLLSEKTKLYTNLQGEEAILLGNYLKTALPVQFKEGKKKDKQNVLSLLITEKKPQLVSPESYILSVTPEHILIQASSGAGLFYGIQTLLQLSQPSDTGYSIASVEVQDTPRFAYRGMMLDVSRHFFSKEFVKKQIDALAFYKLNRLHLHLTDAAGWRLEIRRLLHMRSSIISQSFLKSRCLPIQKKYWLLIRNSPVRVNLIKTQIFVLEMKKHSLS